MAKDIPIILSPLTAPTGASAANLNELITLVARYIQGKIDVDTISFYLSGSVDPTSDQGLFYNTASKVFKTWSVDKAKYLPMTTLVVGDVKTSYVSGDDPEAGWIMLNGRAISVVTGISSYQKSVLESLFGVGGTLPDVSPLATIGTLPTESDINNISLSDFAPADGAIGALNVSNTYVQDEIKAIRDDTETLRDSAASSAAGIDKTKTVLKSLVKAFSGLQAYAKVWVGYP